MADSATKQAMKGSLDTLDRHIIHLLQQNARATSAVLARSLGVSERTVRNRIGRLVEQGVILPTVVVDHRSFGYQMLVDVFCEVDLHRMDEIGRVIARLPEVNYVAYSTGDQDISVQAVLESSEAVYGFVQQLANIPGVRRTRTVLVPRIIKNIHEWLPPACDFGPYPRELPPIEEE